MFKKKSPVFLLLSFPLVAHPPVALSGGPLGSVISGNILVPLTSPAQLFQQTHVNLVGWLRSLLYGVIKLNFGLGEVHAIEGERFEFECKKTGTLSRRISLTYIQICYKL